MKLSLKYKLLAVLLVVVVTGISTFFFFSRKTFLEDKKLFVLDWSLTTLKASTSEIKLELQSRLDELAILLPRLFQNSTASPFSQDALVAGLSDRLPKEILAVTFYEKSGSDLVPFKRAENTPLIEKLGFEPTALNLLDQLKPLNLDEGDLEGTLNLVNRSIKSKTSSGFQNLPILTLVLNGSLINNPGKETIISVDLTQGFLQKTLKQSELAELFLISKSGFLVSHPNSDTLVNFSGRNFEHPASSKIKSTNLPREAFEMEIGKEAYLGNLASTGIGDAYLVSQIKKTDAFSALRKLGVQSLQIGLLIIAVALIVSVVFSAKLTENIKKLEKAAQEIGAGNLTPQVDIHSGDEVESVANTFKWMTGKITSLLKETAEKARMEEELATASLIQNTILTPPKINIATTDVVPFYRSASECGGDLWDAFVQDNKLTVLIGDATGHGAPAAIVTAVVKSCIATLNQFQSGQTLSPSEILERVNEIVFQSCKGQLLMTMAVAQLDLKTGMLTISNAGHEAPLLVKTETQKPGVEANRKPKAEPLFVRGERLGFQEKTSYENLNIQLEPGDTVLVYSDGISEAHNPEGKIWGERALRTTFAKLAQEPLASIKDKLISSMEDFAKGAHQEDDITFVLFSWKKSGLSEQTSSVKAA